MTYVASPWQNEFHSLTVKYALGAGSAGPGKTECLIYEPAELIKFEHERCQLKRSDPRFQPWGMSQANVLFLKRLEKQALGVRDRMSLAYKKIDPGCEWYETKKRFEFSSGLKLYVGHCKDRGDWQLYQGEQYVQILYDELNQFLETQWEWINTRLRVYDDFHAPFLKIRAMSNPTIDVGSSEDVIIDDPYWVRRVFIDPAPEGRVRMTKTVELRDGSEEVADYIYLPARLWDNPNKAYVRRYEAHLRGMKPHIRKALLEGDWYYVAGAFHAEEWDKAIHVVEPRRVNPEWARFRVLDWGSKTQGCLHWYHVTPEDALVCEKEVLFKGKSPTEVVNDIIKPYEKSQGLWNIARNCSDITGPADTQLWEERDGHSATKYLEFLKAGVTWVQADKYRRKRNAEHLTRRLKDTHKGTVAPLFRVYEGCNALIRLLPSVPSDPKDSNCPKDFEGDHAYDDALYACAYASRPLPKRQPLGLERPSGRRQYRAGFGWSLDG